MNPLTGLFDDLMRGLSDDDHTWVLTRIAAAQDRQLAEFYDPETSRPAPDRPRVTFGPAAGQWARAPLRTAS